MNRDYIVISPCRNEADYMRQTLDTMAKQTVLPKKWLIIDDGSTDETPDILAEYAAKHDWIEVLTRTDRGHRAVGPGVIQAFYAGYDTINPKDYNYVCKLDLDLRLPEKYFELLIERMEGNPDLGTCSGKSYIELPNGELKFEFKGDDTSVGASKFYRRECFEEIGGFEREVMWDGIDCHKCRMLGWVAASWNDPEIRFIHLRPMGSSQKGIITGRMRHGFGQYYMGSSFIYFLATCIFRMKEKPYIIGGIAMMWGWIKSALKNEKRFTNPEFRAFLRDYQWKVLRMGKQKALEAVKRPRKKMPAG